MQIKAPADSRNTAATRLDHEISKTGVLVLNVHFLPYGHLQCSEIRAQDLGDISCQRGQGSPSALGQFSHRWYRKQLPREDSRQGSGCPALGSYLQPGSPSLFRNKSRSTPGVSEFCKPIFRNQQTDGNTQTRETLIADSGTQHVSQSTGV